MATSFLGATALDRHEVQLSFDDAVSDPAETPWAFAIGPDASGVDVVVADAVLTSTVLVTVHIETGMSPGEAYTITMDGFVDANGDAIVGFDSFVVPADNVVDRAEWPHGILEALTRAFGQEMQETGGRLTTISTFDYSENDTDLYVESVLGWPTRGAFFVNGRRFRFRGIGDDGRRILNVLADFSQETAIPRRSLVVLDFTSVEPDDFVAWNLGALP